MSSTLFEAHPNDLLLSLSASFLFLSCSSLGSSADLSEDLLATYPAGSTLVETAELFLILLLSSSSTRPLLNTSFFNVSPSRPFLPSPLLLYPGLYLRVQAEVI